MRGLCFAGGMVLDVERWDEEDCRFQIAWYLMWRDTTGFYPLVLPTLSGSRIHLNHGAGRTLIIDVIGQQVVTVVVVQGDVCGPCDQGTMLITLQRMGHYVVNSWSVMSPNCCFLCGCLMVVIFTGVDVCVTYHIVSMSGEL